MVSRLSVVACLLLLTAVPNQIFAKKNPKSKKAATTRPAPKKAITPKAATATPYYIIVDKSDNTLTVYDSDDWLVQYPCTFGSDDLGDKMKEGDRRTPEGRFHILSKYPHKKWKLFMMLDYPTKTDYDKFNQRKAKGIIPASAKIGGAIGIHGTWPREDWAVENLQAWTLGCVSMKNEDIEELYNMIAPGTLVIIQR
ncbi:MAG: L,D-transpeptidase [Bacteroidota bacterium]